jgi:uncharacterized membrane protein
MKFQVGEFAALVLVIFSFTLSMAFYSVMPSNVASHWDANGQVDGYMPKTTALFLFPCIYLLLFGLFTYIPKIDPRHENIEKFRDYYDQFIVTLFLFLLDLQILMIYWNLGGHFNMVAFLAPAFGLMLFALGTLLQHTEPNWTIGIRTPWTLSSDEVWKKTHQLGGTLFKISGAIALLGIVLPAYGIFFFVTPLIVSAAYASFYSYRAYYAEGVPSQKVERKDFV